MRQSSLWLASSPDLQLDDSLVDCAVPSVPVPSEMGPAPPPPPVTSTPSSASTTTTRMVPAPPPTASPRPPPMPRRSWIWPVSSRAPLRNRMRERYPAAGRPTWQTRRRGGPRGGAGPPGGGRRLRGRGGVGPQRPAGRRRLAGRARKAGHARDRRQRRERPAQPRLDDVQRGPRPSVGRDQ